MVLFSQAKIDILVCAMGETISVTVFPSEKICGFVITIKSLSFGLFAQVKLVETRNKYV